MGFDSGIFKSVLGFFIRAANGQNSPQLRYENTPVALTCLLTGSELHSFR
jgi:hypothetical protein